MLGFLKKILETNVYGMDHAVLNMQLPPQTMWMNMGYWEVGHIFSRNPWHSVNVSSILNTSQTPAKHYWTRFWRLVLPLSAPSQSEFWTSDVDVVTNRSILQNCEKTRFLLLSARLRNLASALWTRPPSPPSDDRGMRTSHLSL